MSLEVVTLSREAVALDSVHPAFPDYPMTLSLVMSGQVVEATIPQKRSNGRFRSTFRRLDRFGPLPQGTFVMAGETREIAEISGERDRPGRNGAQLTVEEILALRPSSTEGDQRATWRHLAELGYGDPDIVDLLYYDILGRRSDIEGRNNRLRYLRQHPHAFDTIRRELLGSHEFKSRKVSAKQAPGSLVRFRFVSAQGLARTIYIPPRRPDPITLKNLPGKLRRLGLGLARKAASRLEQTRR